MTQFGSKGTEILNPRPMTCRTDLFPAADRMLEALCPPPSPVFFLFYPKEERVEDSTCFPEQILPHCILPLGARHRPALIALSIFQRFRQGMRLFRLSSTLSLLDGMLGGTYGPVPEHTDCVKLPPLPGSRRGKFGEFMAIYCSSGYKRMVALSCARRLPLPEAAAGLLQSSTPTAADASPNPDVRKARARRHGAGCCGQPTGVDSGTWPGDSASMLPFIPGISGTMKSLSAAA